MRIFLPIGIALLSACSSSSDPPATPPTDSGSVDTATPIAKNYGSILVQRRQGPDKTTVALEAKFRDAPYAVCPNFVDVGSCRYSRCPTGMLQPGYRSEAGNISVVHGSDAPIELVSSAGYAKSDLPATFFAEGDTITFSASGAQVPAFSEKVVAPGDVTGMLTNGIARSKDLTIKWAGGTTGEVRLFLYGTVEDDSEIITCSAPAADGTLTIPKELLGKIESTSGVMALTPTVEKIVEAGDWGVHLTVEALGPQVLLSFF